MLTRMLVCVYFAVVVFTDLRTNTPPFYSDRQALYHCPNRQCGKEFKALAAVINHLESETCGAMRFGTVQRRIGDFVSGDRLLKFN